MYIFSGEIKCYYHACNILLTNALSDDRDLSNMAKERVILVTKKSVTKLGVYMIAVAAVISYFGYSMFKVTKRNMQEHLCCGFIQELFC